METGPNDVSERGHVQRAWKIGNSAGRSAPTLLLRTARWLLAAALLAAVLPIWAPAPASADESLRIQPDTGLALTALDGGRYEITKKTGDYLIKNMTVWIKATNKSFNKLNYQKSKSYMGGNEYWVRKRRQATGYWFFVGKGVNDISDNERQLIVRDYWPTPPPDCGACVIAAGDGARPRSSTLFEQAGFVMNAAVAAQITKESGGAVEVEGYPTIHASSCTGVTKTVNRGNNGFDMYYDSCETNRMKRWLGYTAAACGAIFGAGSLKAIVSGAKNIAQDRGVTLGAALIGAGCYLGTTSSAEGITAAQERSDKNAVIKQVRQMAYQPLPWPGHYQTDTRWVPQ